MARKYGNTVREKQPSTLWVMAEFSMMAGRPIPSQPTSSNSTATSASATQTRNTTGHHAASGAWGPALTSSAPPRSVGCDGFSLGNRQRKDLRMFLSEKMLIKTTHIHSIEIHQLFLLWHQYRIFSPLKTDLLDFTSAIHISIEFLVWFLTIYHYFIQENSLYWWNAVLDESWADISLGLVLKLDGKRPGDSMDKYLRTQASIYWISFSNLFWILIEHQLKESTDTWLKHQQGYYISFQGLCQVPLGINGHYLPQPYTRLFMHLRIYTLEDSCYSH